MNVKGVTEYYTGKTMIMSVECENLIFQKYVC